MLSKRQNLAIGIDLGTTFSCVGVYHKGAVKIISNEDGNRITPSCVSFTDDGILKGERAKQRLSMAPENTVYEVKRLMGKSFDDPTVQAYIKTWPFKIISDGGKPKIKVVQKGMIKKMAPEEISAMVLTNMKQIAEKYLGMPVSRAVITVPAYFDANQRHATEVAANIAGLEVLRIINEPTAAALAYYDEGDFPSGKNVMVFDLGGGTFDVSVLKFEPGILEVVSTKGDTHLGGADFDDKMVKKCLEWFNNNSQTYVSNTPNSGPIIRLRNECERVKCILSKKDKAEMLVDLFANDEDFSHTFTRSTFEELNILEFKRTIGIVEEALSDAHLRKDQIDEIVLVGGSSRIPKLQSLLQTFFNNKPVNKSINPDEAVAYGAALQAAILNEDQGRQIKDLLLLDVTPLSLGVRKRGELMSKIIKRNTLIPTSHTKNYTTVNDFQTSILFDVYQGERSSTRYNHKIGSLTIDDIPPAPAGVAKVMVTMDITTNGTVFVVVVDKATGNEKHITITNDKTRANKEDVKKMIEDAEHHQKEDKREYERVTARNDLESFVKWMKLVIDEFGDTLVVRDEPQEIQNAMQWIQTHMDCTTEDYNMKKMEVQSACGDIPSEYKIPGKLPTEHSNKYSRPAFTRSQRYACSTGSVYDLD